MTTTLNDIRLRMKTPHAARELGYVRITYTYDLPHEEGMLLRACEQLQAGSISWCVVRMNPYHKNGREQLAIGRTGIGNPGKHNEKKDGWDLGEEIDERDDE